MNSHSLSKENLLLSFPIALQGDKSVFALGDTAAAILAQEPDRINRVAIYPSIDDLPEDLLDILAYDFKVDWYDYEYPIAAKRALIKGNVLTHKRQGTVYATRSVLDSLYPKSAMEEWFEYGGNPGCFRLNVNITNSAMEGAVIVYSTEEILRRLSTVKRLSAHLDGVSYMVRNAIVVGHRIDSWQYRLPYCGPTICGTWWMRKTLGWSEKHKLAVSGRAEPFEVSPELSGTLPVIKTPGYSLRAGLRVSGRADAHGIAPEFTGTLPEQSSKGYTLVCGAVRTGGVIDTFEGSPKEAGVSEKAGTWPDETTKGYTIAGTLTIGIAADGFKISPEYTGTLPEEAQHGER